MTADPYVASGGVGSPAGWNRYAYVENDPVNAIHPEGLKSLREIIGGIWDAIKGGNAETGGGPTFEFPPREYRYNAEPSDWKSPLAQRLRDQFRKGEITDCDALVAFTRKIADRAYDTEPGYGGSGTEDERRAQFIRGFRDITPRQFPTGLLPIATMPRGYYTGLNPGVPSGFATQYRDELPNADQAHHFAAFLQLGYATDAWMGKAAAYGHEVGELTWSNSGDIVLGTLAGKWGAQNRNGEIAPKDLADMIRSTICGR